MDIYLLRDGQESGPFSEKAAQELLLQGEVAATDFACRSGMDEWVPLGELLAAERPTTLPVQTPTPPSEGKFEAATAKQKALLSFLGIALTPDLSRDQAARLVNDAMEDPENTERLTLWNEERLRLHPELFAGEIQAKKENRANHFLELCQTTGAAYFSGITKAHCQVLVGFLDVKFPHWDARESEAGEHYFYPAVAEKFPQLVLKQWRGRLHYVGGMKVAPEISRRSPTSQLRQSATSPLTAVMRGVFLGVFVLAVLYLGYRTMHHDVVAAAPGNPAPSTEKAAEPAASPATGLPPSPAPNPSTVAAAPVPKPAPTEPIAANTPPEPTIAAVPAPAAMPAPTVTPLPDAGMSAAPMAALPPAVPPPAGTPDAGMAAMNSGAIATAPMAALPGAEPPVPVPPPPATLPAAGSLPSAPPPAALPSGLPPGLPTAPPDPSPLPPGTSEPPFGGIAAKTNLVLTKSVEVQIGYGKIMLPPGTPVKLVSRQGATLKVSYRNGVISVPVASTDLE